MPKGGIRTSLSLQANYTTTFNSGGLFSPGNPPVPATQEQIRLFDFAPGANLQYQPRAYDPFGFPHLRAFSNVELCRLAIETRKDQIERLDWQVRPRDGRKPRQDAQERINKAEKLLRKPDGVMPFATWLRVLIEDLLVLDAPTVERRRSRNGKLIALDYVDGASIKCLIDDNGRRPLAPDPAYQQVIKGRIWNSLSTDDLIYLPRNPRSGHMYGFSPVEQTIVTLNTIMRRQAGQLAHFTDGNLPAGLINVPEGWTAAQVKDYQDWMDAKFAGNLAERSKLLWAPFGSKYQAFKDAPIKDEFDEWLARVICFAFSLPPTAFIRQMNKSTADSDEKRAMEEGCVPLQLWAKRLFDGVIQDDLGFTDLEFSWKTTVEVSPEVQAKIDDMDLRNGKRTLDEVRDASGLDPIPGGAGSHHLIYTAAGATTLEDVLDPPEPPVAAANATGDPNAPAPKKTKPSAPADDKTAPKPKTKD
jgi:hypothetical protein